MRRIIPFLVLILWSFNVIGLELSWNYTIPKEQSIRYSVQIYSTTNVIFTQDQIHDALSKWLVIFPVLSDPQSIKFNIYDAIPVTQDMLPPVNQWQRYASVVATNKTFKIQTFEKRRFFAITILDTYTGIESGYSR